MQIAKSISIGCGGEMDMEMEEEKNSAFSLGDIVTMKSGGPLMTVAKLLPFDSDGRKVMAFWMDQNRQTGKWQANSALLPEETLDLWTGDKFG